MASLPDITGRVRIDTRGLATAQGQVQKFGDGLKTHVKVGAIAAGAALGVFVKNSIKAGSDLAESVDKIKVVFGAQSEEVLKFADNSAKAFGQSKQQALEAAGTFGNLLVSMKLPTQQAAEMSKRMVVLASDLASLNNSSPEEALTALRAGLVGETEPLKRFGVNLNEAVLQQEALRLGLVKTKGTLDANTKAQAAYSVILKQTGTAQGNFKLTSGGLANQQRILAAEFANLQAEVGKRLVPVMLQLVDATRKVLTFFTEHPAVLNFAFTLTKVAAAALAINYALKAGRAIRNSTLLQTIAQTKANYALARSQGAVAASSGAGGLAGRGGALVGAAGPLAAAAVAGYVGGKGVSAAIENFGTGRMGRNVPDWMKTRSNKQLAGEEAERSAGFALTATQQAANRSGTAGKNILKLYADEIKNAQSSGSVERLTDVNKRLSESLRGVGLNAVAGAKGLKLATDKLSGLGTHARKLADSILGSFNVFGELPKKAALSVKELINNLMARNKYQAELASDYQALINAGLSGPVRAALLKAEDQFPGTIRNLVKRGLTGPLVKQLNMGQAGVIAGVSALTSKMAAPSVLANAGAAGTKVGNRFANNVERAIRNIKVTLPAALRGPVRQAGSGKGAITMEERALGGPVFAGRAYVVGEKRPELFVPHTDGTILPNVPAGGPLIGQVVFNRDAPDSAVLARMLSLELAKAS